jgi:hypothetical protein
VSDSHDTVNCVIFTSTAGGAQAACGKGGCNADGGACADAGAPCYCTQNGDCGSGGLCVSVGGQNSASCATPGHTCTGSGTHDGFDCQLGQGPEVSAATSCLWGIVSVTNPDACVANAGSRCGAGSCVKTAANGNASGCVGTGGNGADSYSCLQPTSAPTGGPGYMCTAGTPNAGDTACLCTDGAQCGGRTCDGGVSASTDSDGCNLPTVTPVYGCGTGAPSPDGGACWCTANAQCASGHCFNWAGCAAAACTASSGAPDCLHCGP